MSVLSSSPKARLLLQGLAWFTLFQAAWFACVLGAAQGHAELGMLAVAAVVALTGAASDARGDELRLTALALLIGLGWDTALLQFGLLVYASPGPLPGLAPPWILALWALFATLLRGPLAWLHGRPLLSAALGAAGGPLSYLAAVRLGAGSFPDDARALLVLALGWAVMTPALTEAAHHLERRRRADRLG